MNVISIEKEQRNAEKQAVILKKYAEAMKKLKENKKERN